MPTIPNTLPASWTAPAGAYTVTRSIPVTGVSTVNLSAATITGSGFVFTLRAGGRLTIIGGRIAGVDGRLRGLVRDDVADGGIGAVTVVGTTLTGVRSVVYSYGQSGVANVVLDHVTATGLGDGVRTVSNALTVENSVLTGGGVPVSGDPVGVHSLDDDFGHVAVPGSYLDVVDSTITGFRSNGFQGDGIVGETRVASADIEHNVLGHNSDSAAVDSKIHSVTLRYNTVYSDGFRAIASHYGTLNSSNNTIYQAARSATGETAQAYQATGVLNASNDVVSLSAGARLATATTVPVPGSGPASTYPRVGTITLTHIVSPTGAQLLGPLVTSGTSRFTPSAHAR